MKFIIISLLLLFVFVNSKASPGCQLSNGDFYTQLVSGKNYTGAVTPWENSPGVTGCSAHINGGVLSDCTVNGSSTGNLYDISIVNCSLDDDLPYLILISIGVGFLVVENRQFF